MPASYVDAPRSSWRVRRDSHASALSAHSEAICVQLRASPPIANLFKALAPLRSRAAGSRISRRDQRRQPTAPSGSRTRIISYHASHFQCARGNAPGRQRAHGARPRPRWQRRDGAERSDWRGQHGGEQGGAAVGRRQSVPARWIFLLPSIPPPRTRQPRFSAARAPPQPWAALAPRARRPPAACAAHTHTVLAPARRCRPCKATPSTWCTWCQSPARCTPRRACTRPQTTRPRARRRAAGRRRGGAPRAWAGACMCVRAHTRALADERRSPVRGIPTWRPGRPLT